SLVVVPAVLPGGRDETRAVVGVAVGVAWYAEEQVGVVAPGEGRELRGEQGLSLEVLGDRVLGPDDERGVRIAGAALAGGEVRPELPLGIGLRPPVGREAGGLQYQQPLGGRG